MITENILYHINNVHRQQNYIGLVYGVQRHFQKYVTYIVVRSVLLASSLAKGYDPLYSSSPLASLVGFS
jgi:hypothetical protein